MDIYAFADSEGLARRVARIAKAHCITLAVHRFPDGETLLRVARPSGRRAIVLRSLDDPNPKLMEVLQAADALRRAGARRVVLVSPYLPYMRQDKVFHAGEPISQRVIGQILSTGFDRVIALEPHLHRTRRLASVFPCGAEALSAAPAIARWIRDRGHEGWVVAGPDRESGATVNEVAKLAGLDSIVGVKQRLGDRSVRVSFRRRVEARGAVIVDDIASSGTTLAEAVKALRRNGIRSVEVVVAHALFERGAIARIRAAGARRIVSCDSIEHSTNAIEIAAILVEAIASPGHRR